MAKFDVVDMSGKKVSTVELSDAVFGITPNEKAVHEAVVNFLANQRQGSSQPNREVPPMEHWTMRFFISTLPILNGVNSGAYFSFIIWFFLPLNMID